MPPSSQLQRIVKILMIVNPCDAFPDICLLFPMVFTFYLFSFECHLPGSTFSSDSMNTIVDVAENTDVGYETVPSYLKTYADTCNNSTRCPGQNGVQLQHITLVGNSISGPQSLFSETVLHAERKRRGIVKVTLLEK